MPSDRADTGPARPEALVRRFLALLEARELDAASRLLAPEVEMVFPGGARFHRLEQLIEWAGTRYARIAKRIDRVDTAPAEPVAGGAIVIVQGVLFGEWLDGTPFDGIRFIDWFELKDGLVSRQHVWNDLAEAMRRSAIAST